MEPHKVTALVGYTGAGKSSIAKLLMRTYDPDSGRITVDGADIRELAITSYRQRLGIVPQDPFVFQGTVASNIRYGKPDATDAEVDAAVRSVGAYDMLSVAARRIRVPGRGGGSQPDGRAAPAHRARPGRGSRSPTCSCSTSRRRCSTTASRTR